MAHNDSKKYDCIFKHGAGDAVYQPSIQFNPKTWQENELNYGITVYTLIKRPVLLNDLV